MSKLISGNLSPYEVWGFVKLLQPENQWLHQLLLPSAISRRSPCPPQVPASRLYLSQVLQSPAETQVLMFF